MSSVVRELSRPLMHCQFPGLNTTKVFVSSKSVVDTGGVTRVSFRTVGPVFQSVFLKKSERIVRIPLSHLIQFDLTLVKRR